MCAQTGVHRWDSEFDSTGKSLAGRLKDRSNHLRQDGGLCFEIPPWQHKPVEVEEHLKRIRQVWGNHSTERRTISLPRLALINREVNRYVDTVIAPFLDTYHRNIQNSYQQLTNKFLKRIKDEINVALKKKRKIYTELTELADSLKLPEMCNEERRATKTQASKHVALIYKCTEQARSSISKMGKYAEEMISITQNHMGNTLELVGKKIEMVQNSPVIFKTNVTVSLKELAKAAVALGYELDLSLTNARRYNEQSCEKLTNCCIKAKRSTEEAVYVLRELLYQCVYA
ncbi:uncharacterized protein LOC125071137 [Vanessa atalanta]|uniref:uncharacterized protein LOC125071137 n=1 Tax=Vanessa atalanta TaxID=42275 RepID=UPI001FCD7EFB|nr:uncharacterized protein LOC125071137 [Vanessa atalanta]